MKLLRNAFLCAATCALPAHTEPQLVVLAPVRIVEDPIALAAARPIAAKLITSSYFKEMIAPPSNRASNRDATISHEVARQVARFSGLSELDIALLDPETRTKVMTIFDPYWKERNKISDDARFTILEDIYKVIEPKLHEAYAKALAHSFNADELNDINQYLSTPIGLKFASRYFKLSNDRDVWFAKDSAISRVVAERPRIEATVQKAIAGLPMPSTIEDMTPLQRAGLATALGVDPSNPGVRKSNHD